MTRTQKRLPTDSAPGGRYCQRAGTLLLRSVFQPVPGCRPDRQCDRKSIRKGVRDTLTAGKPIGGVTGRPAIISFEASDSNQSSGGGGVWRDNPGIEIRDRRPGANPDQGGSAEIDGQAAYLTADCAILCG